ncbi:hypothetical protein FRX31_030041 [Thalictrum thalictroides]|uniref:RNase H type-1 domain-containing protein n=1 Tax=Thalictrum thalictroides TaxID=46969 RepID=A0A7J6V7I8_THATH|nr:hypothetical protein FRX31_030041 [Thalictrum thalictroides]
MSADLPIGIGFILSVCKGQFIGAGSTSCHAGSSEEGECTGVLVGIKWAKEQRVKKLILESDNKRAVEALMGLPTNLSWMYYKIIQETLSYFQFFDVITIGHCNRSGNHAAHILSKHADTSNMVSNIYGYPPAWLTAQLADDLMFCNLNYV